MQLKLPAQPLLFIDIDGVLSLFGFSMDARPQGSFQTIDGMVHFLSGSAAEHLHTLAGAFSLVWCSGWEEKANEYLPHLLKLPGELPYLTFEHNPGRTHAHWKLDAIDAYAGARKLAWIDDAFNEACHDWATLRGAPTLLVQTLPPTGMTEVHVAALLEFAASG